MMGEYTAISSEDNPNIDQDLQASDIYSLKYSGTSSLKVLLLSSILIISISINVYAVTHIRHNTARTERSPYTALARDTPFVYHAHTDYWSEDQTLADRMWEEIDTSPIAVALDHEWARQKGLPEAGPFPWDDSKGTYFIKVFHQLHCLKLMRRMTLDYRDGKTPLTHWAHYDHCLDAIRKDIMCYADDTPMPGHPDRHLGEGQVMQCRSWDKLVEWTQAPERQSCYRSLSDYRPIKHTLERYAFCPKDSPYYDIQHEYFERFGHKQVFEDRGLGREE